MLPVEIREQIYTYVLTEPSGLTFCTGADGADRICARKKETVRVSTLRRHLLALSNYLYDSLSLIPRGAAIAAEEREFNQIQYVRRQCYRESHGLEFRYNKISFEDSRSASAGQRCRLSVNKVVNQRHAHMQYLNFSIRGADFSFQPSTYGCSAITLAQFCRQNPKVSLGYTIRTGPRGVLAFCF